jgi:hypothetical protein
MVKKRGPYHKDKKIGREERLKLKEWRHKQERERESMFFRGKM